MAHTALLDRGKPSLGAPTPKVIDLRLSDFVVDPTFRTRRFLLLFGGVLYAASLIIALSLPISV